MVGSRNKKICKMCLENLVVPENKEVPNTYKYMYTHMYTHTYITEYVRGIQDSTEGAPHGQSREILYNKMKYYWIIIQNIK